MKRAQIRKYGGKEVVEFDENAPKPPLSKGQILVEVYAAGVNPIDWKIREGYLRERVPLRFPATLGGDFSGLVAEVGEGVSGFKKGEEVYGYASILRGGSGSFAEFASVDAKATAPKPKNISYAEAAALPLVGVSAWQALVYHTGLSRGQKILIHGGAGGIGQIAVQLAMHLGAYVATTVSAKDIPYVKGLGANEVMDYKSRPFEELVENFDAVFDTIGGDTYVRSFKALKEGGIIVSMLEQPRSELMEKHGVTAIGQFTQVNSERLSKLTELAEKRVIKVNVDKTFSLGQAGEALEYLQKGHPRGKVVLRVKQI
jgi:NADPH:quinone reductase-like Zn-dependent oxidoreductase